ncbi:MAG: hypothetical protein EA378_10445 [Phycisphaerales bacterium]|nr:MAG: hypothetical protein EA378_10445 [Phycisphaerales bacterium]
MGTRLRLATPTDYELARDVCSYGYFVLWPNFWDVRRRTLTRPLELADGPATCVIGQSGGTGAELRVVFDRALTRGEQGEARRQITRMLRLDEDAEHVRAFHAADPRWAKSGRGRLFRSPTMFEDVIKTVTSCNVAWPSTVRMNRRLCEVLGRASSRDAPPGFPSVQRVARTKPGTLRARCGVGYRDQRIVELAKLFRPRGQRPPEMDPAWFEDPATSDADVRTALLALPGIGPYAAANIMQLLGRYGAVPLDTESVRHGKTVLGLQGTDREIMRAVDAHFAPFGPHVFRSYWFELWAFYESKQGPAWSWERDRIAESFTAAQFRD